MKKIDNGILFNHFSIGDSSHLQVAAGVYYTVGTKL